MKLAFADFFNNFLPLSDGEFNSMYKKVKNDAAHTALFILGDLEESVAIVKMTLRDAKDNIRKKTSEEKFRKEFFKILINNIHLKASSRSRSQNPPKDLSGLRLNPPMKRAVEVYYEISTLPFDDRVMLVLNIIGGYSSMEMESIMDIPASAIRGVLRRTLQKFQRFSPLEDGDAPVQDMMYSREIARILIPLRRAIASDGDGSDIQAADVPPRAHPPYSGGESSSPDRKAREKRTMAFHSLSGPAGGKASPAKKKQQFLRKMILLVGVALVLAVVVLMVSMIAGALAARNAPALSVPKSYSQVYDAITKSNTPVSFAASDTDVNPSLYSSVSSSGSADSGGDLYIQQGDQQAYYTRYNNTVRLIDTKAQTGLNLQSETVSALESVSDLFIQGKFLGLIGQAGGKATLSLYDISNPSALTLARTFSQDGNLLTWTVNGNTVHLVSGVSLVRKLSDLDKNNPSTFIPSVSDTAAGTLNGLIPLSGLYCVKSACVPEFKIISSVRLDVPENTSVTAVLDNESNGFLTDQGYCHISTVLSGNIYYIEYAAANSKRVFDGASQTTAVTYFSFEGAKPKTVSLPAAPFGTYRAQQTPQGISFLLSTFQDQLQLKGSVNSLFVLDTDLHLQSRLDNICQNQTVERVFLQDQRLSVTTTAPDNPLDITGLTLIDLSDRSNPRQEGPVAFSPGIRQLLPFNNVSWIAVGPRNSSASDPFQQGLKLDLIAVNSDNTQKVLSTLVIGENGILPSLNPGDYRVTVCDGFVGVGATQWQLSQSKTVLRGAYYYVAKISGDNQLSLVGKATHATTKLVEIRNKDNGQQLISDDAFPLMGSVIFENGKLYTASTFKIMSTQLSDFSTISSVNTSQRAAIEQKAGIS